MYIIRKIHIGNDKWFVLFGVNGKQHAKVVQL